MTHNSFDGEWNLDGLSEYLIIGLIEEMLMVDVAYKSKGMCDHESARLIAAGFSGILKGWWDHKYIDEQRKIILKHKSERFVSDEPVEQTSTSEATSGAYTSAPRRAIGREEFEDDVITLTHAIAKAFVGKTQNYNELASLSLNNLTCPKLSDFRWYKDSFLA